jgi:23S rRNA (uracil1939-C5)-methyltransferase
VGRQLARWDHPTDVIRTPLSLEDPWFYRNKMEMTFGYDADRALALGLHPPGYRYEVFSMAECFLQSEESTALTRAVAEWARAWELTPFVSKERGGFLRTLMIREGKRTGDRLLELVTEPFEGHAQGDPPPAAIDAFLETVLSAGVAVSTVYWTRIHAVAGARTWMEELLLHGPPTLREELHVPGQPPLCFEIHPRAFFQPNTRGAELLYEQVVQACGALEEKHVLDLYCGTGTIALYLARHARAVVGIELEPDAVNNARANARNNGIDNVTFYAGDVGKVLAEMSPRADVVVVDPPRSGLDVSARQNLVATGAPRLVYVSCNPEALARDLVALEHSGFRLLSIQPLDLFPQTAHIENVAIFVRDEPSHS